MSARRSQIPLASNDQVMTELLQKLSDEIKESGKVRRVRKKITSVAVRLFLIIMLRKGKLTSV